MNTKLVTVTVRRRQLVMHQLWALSLSVSALATMPLTAVAAHSKYSFTRIADDTGPLGEIGISPVAIETLRTWLREQARALLNEPVIPAHARNPLVQIEETHA